MKKKILWTECRLLINQNQQVCLNFLIKNTFVDFLSFPFYHLFSLLVSDEII